MASQTPANKSIPHNQQLRLHQDQAAFTSCLAFLELADIIHCLQVCHHWYDILTSENQYGLLAWSSCIYKLDEHLHLARKWHPFIRQLRFSESVGRLSSNALSTFTHLTSIHLTPNLKHGSTNRRPELQQKVQAVWGLINTNTPNIHSPIISFHLSWSRNVTNLFPLQRVLENPRFAALQELSILKPCVQTKEAMLAIGGLKEIRKLKCHVQLKQLQGDVWSWSPNLILFEVIHQLPLLHTLSVSEIPEGIAPLPSTITDLSIRDLPRDPVPLYLVLGSLTQLRSFSFGILKFVSDHGWTDWINWIKWLNNVNTFEFVHIYIGGERETILKSMQLVDSFVLHNSSQLAIRSVKCNEVTICEMELIRTESSPRGTVLLPEFSSQHLPIQLHHPLRFFQEWTRQLRALKELYLVNLPLTSSLMTCLAHLSSTSNGNVSRLEHLELGSSGFTSSTSHFTVDQQAVTQFCEFLGQQAHLRSFTLQGHWVHKASTQLGDALGHCQELRNVELNTRWDEDCKGRCTDDLARILSELPHLSYLHLIGACLSHPINLTLLAASTSLRQLDCEIMGYQNPAINRTSMELAQLLISHPHIQTTLNKNPTRPLPQTISTAAKRSVPSTRRCLIQ